MASRFRLTTPFHSYYFPSDDDEVTEYGRSSTSIMRELSTYDPMAATAIHRLAHNCYFKVIGVPDKQIEISLHNDNENVELILEHIVFAATMEDLIEQRLNDLVFEDNFNEKILEMAKIGKFTHDKLISVCTKYETPNGMHQHRQCYKQKYKYFTKLGFSKEEAKSNVLAISFYTGSHSECINRASSLLLRQGNRKVLETNAQNDVDDTAIILYYLVRGLSNIPFYWGNVTLACQLTDVELKCYKSGYLVTWLQFSSSKKGEHPPDHFSNGNNTFFFIYSLTGRSIRTFSNFSNEDEILFLPHSTFIVIDHRTQDRENETLHHIYMRQVELGFSKRSILWVDDHIFDEKWENKKHMEKAATRALNQNVHFIPKSNTENAISFLQSPFGERLKNHDNFRIVTDMQRTNEDPADIAGAQLIKHIRELGFRNKCLVFTRFEEKAHKKLNEILSKNENVNVSVTVTVSNLENFINFEN